MDIFDYIFLGYILFFFPTLMISAAVSDLMSMTISNRLNLLLVLGFFIIAPFTDMPWSQIGIHMLTGFGVLLICFILFSLNIIGGGDAKLFAATAIWLGWSSELLVYSVYTSIFGGVLAILFIVLRSKPLPTFLINQKWILKLYTETKYIPYGIAMAIGGLLTYSNGYWMNEALGLMS